MSNSPLSVSEGFYMMLVIHAWLFSGSLDSEQQESVCTDNCEVPATCDRDKKHHYLLCRAPLH